MSQEGESLVSQDADPLPPRDQPNERGASDQSAPAEVPEHQEPANETPVPMPHPKWRFNSFLVELADEIDGAELDKLKALFLDEIGRNVLERLTTARDLFDLLRKRLLIGWDNLVCLQSMLMKLKRPELVQMAVEYARDTGDMIYFYPVAGPVNGYRNIKVHVEGKDFRNCTRRYLRELQITFSYWIGIPPEHVLIAGVQPSSSMLITLMIPDMYADVLETMLTRADAMQPFSELGIDTIQIGEKIFNINGIEGADIVETEQQIKLMSVYQQVQNKTKQLDNMSLEVLNLEDRHNTMTKKLDEIRIENETLKHLFYTSKNGTGSQPVSLSSQAAFAQFKETLQRTQENNYDRSIIGKLLHANSSVMYTRTRDMHAIQLQQMAAQLQQMKLHVLEMQSQLVPLQFELLFHRSNGSGIPETLLRDSQRPLFETLRVQELTVNGNEILKKISRNLRPRDKQKLEKKYTWKPDDYLTVCKNSDQTLFLSCLFYKEVDKTKAFVDYAKFIDECLKEVKRPDLQQKFHQMLANPPSPPPPPPQHQPGVRLQSPPAQRPQGEAPPMQPTEDQLSKLNKTVQDTLEKVSRIESTITTAMNYGQPFDQPFAAKPFPGGAFDFPFQAPTEKQKL